MSISHARPRWLLALGTVSSLLLLIGLAVPGAAGPARPRGAVTTRASLRPDREAESEEEREEMLGIAYSFAAVATAPAATVDVAAFEEAFDTAAGLPLVGGSWSEVQTVGYDGDDHDYRDPFISNSGAGWGFVSGRMTGLAVMPDDGDEAYAGGADGGVWKTIDGGFNWTPVFDDVAASIAVGAVAIDPETDWIWVGTGENNTAFENFKGAGVFVSTDHGTSWQQVGGSEVANSTIGDIEFDGTGNYAYVATSRGLFRHSSTATSGAWTTQFTPAPPDPYGLAIVNDVEVQPGTNGQVVVANAAWRNGSAYNGFYVSRDGGATFTRAKLSGAINPKEVGRASLDYSSDGKKLYTVIESTFLFNKPNVQTGNTVLAGVFVSPSGNPEGPWQKIADYRKLQQSGSALKLSKGYAPGVQAWYNQFVGVDPNDANHVYVGLEEVFETTDGGRSWHAIGPYWNFGLPCSSAGLDECPPTVHPDQHAVAFGDGEVWIGNDGGVYSRSLDASPNSPEGWVNLNETLRTLQYYGAGAGYAPADPANDAIVPGSVMYWGGMQDNGVSLLAEGLPFMVSPFGGDGGYQLVDPSNGDRAVDEYVGLDMWKTTNGGYAPADPDNFDLSSTNAWEEITPACGAFTYTPSPCDPSPRFIAPFTWDDEDIDHWVAGGRYVWTSDEGFDTACSSTDCSWEIAYDTGAGHSVTALDIDGGTIWAGWCGPATGCNPSTASTTGGGFSSGIATKAAGGTWHAVADSTKVLPNRYVSAVAIDPNDGTGMTAYAAYGGFSRRWIDDPSAGVGHVYRTVDGGATWTDASGNLPDAPARDLVITADGTLIVSTDVGVFTSSDSGATWSQLGGNLPHSVVDDLSFTPDGDVLAATHGRGLWTIATP